MQRISLIIMLGLTLCACGGGRPASTGTAPNLTPPRVPVACSMNELSDEEMLNVKRNPADAPLADLSHYQARNAPRNPLAAINGGNCENNTAFRYATGLGDITGAATGSSMAGYVDGNQISTGLLDRQWARAFLLQTGCNGADARVVIVQLDIGLAFHAIRQEVMRKLTADVELKDFYGEHNVMLNASHTHNSAGGQSHFDAYHVLTGGHDAENLTAVVSGVVAAIRKAHHNFARATPGRIGFNQGEVLNGNVQRSLPAYLQNPVHERQRFLDVNGNEVTTNRMMTLLKLVRDDGSRVGMLNYYPIHVTSIWQLNTLLSGDNKGYAAYRFEEDFDTDYFADETFLAGFMQADEGDASPNLFVPEVSEADQRSRDNAAYRARAGGRNEPENAIISGFKQYQKARELYDNASEHLVGGIATAHIFVDFTGVTVANPRDYPPELRPETAAYTTCAHALGVSMGAGAEDGRGPSSEGQTCANTSQQDMDEAKAFFEQNAQSAQGFGLPPGLIVPVGCDNAFYDNQGYDCHAEKPILFALNQRSPFVEPPSEQTLEPAVQKLQIFVIGNLAIIGLPWEVTTMSGRRLRTAILDVLESAGVDYAVISGLSNGFVHYLTTREEYAIQHYEGASTIFGPWSQEAVQQELVNLATQMRDGDPISSPFQAGDLVSIVSRYTNPMDKDEGNSGFGDVVTQPLTSYTLGSDRVEATASFIGGHPRHDFKPGSSYLYIERETAPDTWTAVKTDADWDTRFATRFDDQDRTRYIDITWVIPADTVPGTYRIRHEGTSAVGTYTGISDRFEVLPCAEQAAD